MTSLSDKEKILKEPLSLYEQEAFYKEDVKEAIKELKARLLSDKMFSQCDKDLIELEINEIFGKELSSEEESE